MDNRLNVPQGSFHLARLPRRRRELLRAWDAADEYLLNYLAEQALPASGDNTLILNDGFGALAVALNNHHPQAISDSWLSQQATRDNLAANGLAGEGVTLSSSLQTAAQPVDLLLIKVPKTLALLEYELLRLRPQLKPTTRIIAAGMLKALPSTVWQLFERLVGPTQSSLARKKARLILVTPDLAMRLPDNPYPVHYTLEGTDYQITNHANVFSRDSLDIGTRFFLQHLPQNTAAQDIIDLGCGNGVVGLIAARDNRQATLHFIDESHMAIASARENFQRAHGEGRKATYTLTDGLTGYPKHSADIILCNPPFHQQHSVGDQIAHSMFREARRVLRPGGELWIIGNRHLGYHISLKKLFGNVTQIASNPKFVIFKSTT